METDVQQSRYPTGRFFRFPVTRSYSAGGLCKNQNASLPEILQNRRIRSATSVSNIDSEGPPFLRLSIDSHKLLELNQQGSTRESPKFNQRDFISPQSGSSGNYGFRLLKVNLELSLIIKMKVEITPPNPLRPELLKNVETLNAQQVGLMCYFIIIRNISYFKMRLEQMYKAKLARMSNELRYLRSKSHHDLSRSLPDLSVTGEVSALKMTISQLESEQIDTLRLALHFRDRFKQVLKENADLASKFLEMSEIAELVKQRFAVAETARIHALEEIEILKSRFAEALRDQEIQQRENLNRALNQSDTRLETIKATLILAEKNAADSNVRAFYAESKLEEVMRQLNSSEVENRLLRDEINRLEEEKKISLVAANFTSQKALRRLTFIQEQANMDENEMRESIVLLKSQLQDALTRAEKGQTELESSKEEQIRLLNRIKSLETKSRQTESELVTATQQHELEMKKMVKTAQSRESQLISALKQLTQNCETKIKHAEEIINQQRRLVDKLREECRSNVEVSWPQWVIFNIKLSEMEKQQQILLLGKEKVKELVSSVEIERNRFHCLNVEQLAQVDELTKKVNSLEEQLSERKFQMEHQNAKHRDVLMDAKLLAHVVKQLWTQSSDVRLFESYEIKEAVKRIELLPV
ncbi:unnamed protein product [Hymenolepis diminuta]|uniref:Coiled-coil domain-containing protein 176 n=1 Tax=Hymenolepis diminuta TaxID=6216 RepID=A0A0R3S8L5_HYMDI|nr:unnamed protein product [Hymenolepis diminuta]